jgi:hypothetical protein
MVHSPFSSRQSEAVNEILSELKHELLQIKRPASEIILDDVDLCKLLHISKRTSAEYRAKSMIVYYKLGGKVFYKLADVLTMLDKHKIVTTENITISSSNLKLR